MMMMIIAIATTIVATCSGGYQSAMEDLVRVPPGGNGATAALQTHQCHQRDVAQACGDVAIATLSFTCQDTKRGSAMLG
jgi:hypothetical protein